MSFNLIRKVILSIYGHIVWHKLIKQYTSIQNTAVILLPDYNEDLDNYFAILYLNQFLDKEKKDNAVIITCDKRIKDTATNFSAKIAEIIILKSRKINALIQYALLYEFDSRLIIASLDIPSGRYGSRLIGLNNMSREEIFAVGVYKLFPFHKEHRNNREDE